MSGILNVCGDCSGGFTHVVVEADCCVLSDAFVPKCESEYQLSWKRNVAKKRCFGDGSTSKVCRALMSIE